MSRILNLSLRDVGRGEHKHWGGDHAHSCDIDGLIAIENTWLGRHLGAVSLRARLSLTLSLRVHGSFSGSA